MTFRAFFGGGSELAETCQYVEVQHDYDWYDVPSQLDRVLHSGWWTQPSAPPS